MQMLISSLQQLRPLSIQPWFCGSASVDPAVFWLITLVDFCCHSFSQKLHEGKVTIYSFEVFLKLHSRGITISNIDGAIFLLARSMVLNRLKTFMGYYSAISKNVRNPLSFQVDFKM